MENIQPVRDIRDCQREGCCWTGKTWCGEARNGVQAPVVQRVDNAIHQINPYPMDSVVCFVKNHPLDSDLSGG